MTSILMSKYDISKRWCFKELKKHIKKDSRVAVVAFAFRDSEISCKEDWDKLYGSKGVLSAAIDKSFKHYGIHPESIEYIDYFSDSPLSAKNKIQNADIIFFPGGSAQNIMSRAIKFDLYHVIESHRGVIIGFGAGAQIQLANYHISSEDGRICYSLGFRFAEGFGIETDYSGDEAQNYRIRRVVSEKGIPIYAIGAEGAVVVEDGVMGVIGEVHCFRKRETDSKAVG